MDKKHPANPVDVHVGARLRLRRRLLGISQQNLGEHLGMTFQQVQKYERGVNRVSASVLHGIATKLEVGVGYFFDGLEGAPNAAPSSWLDARIVSFLTTTTGAEFMAAFSALSLAQRNALRLIAVDLAGLAGAEGDETAAHLLHRAAPQADALVGRA